MKNRWILNLALALLVAVLGVLAYFKPGADNVEIPPGLTPLQIDDVTRIRIERPGKKPVALEKIDGAWRLREPLRARANAFNVATLLRLTTARSEFSTPADPSVNAQYGVHEPIAHIWLNDEHIAVGGAHPLDDRRYVLYRDRVHLVPSYTLSAAFFNYTQLIDTRLLEEGRKLVDLRLPSLHMTRKDGVWQLKRGGNGEISADRLNNFAADWEYARGLSAHPRSDKPTLAQARLAFEAEGGKTETLTLDILSYEPVFILARRDEGLEYHFPEDTGKRLLNLPSADANDAEESGTEELE